MDEYMDSLEAGQTIEFEWDDYIYLRIAWNYMLCENMENFTSTEFYNDLEFWDNKRFKDWKQLNYNQQWIDNLKTKEQKEIIEKKEYNKRLNAREDAMIESLERVRNAPKIVFMNHLMKFVDKKEVTQEMKDKEVEWGFSYLI